MNIARQYLNSIYPSTVYNGLVNQGATCYLNSVLQVLFMSKDFRAAVERHASENPSTDCIDLQLRALFDELKKKSAHTHGITRKLDIKEVWEQRDSAVYFEKILSLTSPEASKIFYMQVTHNMTCSGCSMETDSEDPSWHLSLALVDSYSEHYRVVDGVEEYFRASRFSGENQMYCEQCDAKSDATIQSVMRRHPDVLMLLLKRFEFDYRYMAYVKINRSVEVPYTLQIPENQTYELYAVVDHFGDLRSGHYTATIKSQDDGKWYEFNDASVTEQLQMDIKKSNSAYLLFYRKQDACAADECIQDFGDVAPPGVILSASSEIHEFGKIREREEVEGVEDMGNDTAAAVSVHRTEEKDEVGVESRGPGLKSDLCSNVEGEDKDGDGVRQMRSEISDRHAIDQGEMSEMDVKADRTCADRDAERQDNDSGRRDDVQETKPQSCLEGSVAHDEFNEQKYNRHDHPQVCVDMQGDEERMVTDVHRDEDAECEYQGNEGFDYVRQSIKKDQGFTQEGGQDCGLEYVSTDKRGDGERMERDFKAVKEGKSGAGERGLKSGREKLLTISDYQSQDNGGIGDSEQKMPKGDQKCKQARSSRYERHRQETEERRDAQWDEEQKRGGDKAYLSEGVKDQDKRRSDDVTQKKFSVTYENVCVERKPKEQQKKDNEPGVSGAGSMKGRENMRRGNSQPKAGAEDAVKERQGSKKSKIVVRIIEEEIRGPQKSSETKTLLMETNSDQKTLSESFRNLNVSNSSLTELQKHGKKRAFEGAQEDKEAKKKRKCEKRGGRYRNLLGSKKHRKEKKKPKKITGCFRFFKKSSKNAGQTSESE